MKIHKIAQSDEGFKSRDVRRLLGNLDWAKDLIIKAIDKIEKMPKDSTMKEVMDEVNYELTWIGWKK